MIDISIISIAMDTADRVEVGKERKFTEQERYEIAKFAFKSDSEELTECMVIEMAYSLNDTATVIARYQLLLDDEDECAGKISDLLVLLEMLRIKRTKAINELRAVLREYGLDVVPVSVENNRGQKGPRR